MKLPENLFLNFHAHLHGPGEEEIVIQSKFLQENLIASESDKVFFTAGLHPWHADLMTGPEIRQQLHRLIDEKKIIAVGETGLDKLKGPEQDIQLKVFNIHTEIAALRNLPVIVHSVRFNNEILKMKMGLPSKAPWVIHHFNGSREMALGLINNGFYLSLCHHIGNPGSKLSHYLNKLPLERIFFETDDFDVNIRDLYAIAATKFNIGIEQLKKQIMNNFNTVFHEY